MGFLKGFAELHDLERLPTPEGPLAARELRSKPWHARQQLHMLRHVAKDQMQRWGSPRNFWCYRDEPFVGACKSICAKTRHPRTLEQVVLDKSAIHEAVARLCASR